ncbi:MAG: hypothetical protein J6N45_02715 [Alphaproteobacteria bacterium]|nr:hypothetical protein [Alphaproteobacteria bacterium]
MLYFNYFTNPCQQVLGRISAIIEQPKTVWQIIKEQKVDLTMPVLCLINGAPVLRKDWGNVFDDGELISIVSLPLGGGSKKSSNPVQMPVLPAFARVQTKWKSRLL